MATNQGENRAENQTRIDGEHDRRYDDNGQGAVKDPAHDGRLTENREAGVSMQDTENEPRQQAASRSNDRSNARSTK